MNSQELEREYQSAFQHYLAEPEESALLRAYELGREALTEGLGVLEIASAHSRAVGLLLSTPRSQEEQDKLLEAQANFFLEALAPFEMAHRAFREANGTLRRMNEMLEGQAKRIAYSLHDEASQLLASVHLGLAEASRLLPDETGRQLTAVRTLLHEIEERLRNLSHELRPPVLDLGLFPALQFMAEAASKRWSLPVVVKVSVQEPLPATVETMLYRVAQEALTNAAKHARANMVEIDLRQTAHKVVCSIRDDGIGFDANAPLESTRRPGMGLLEIKERVASMDGLMRVGPNVDRGTDLTIEIPLDT